MVAGSGPGSRRWEDFGERFTAAGLAAYAHDKPGVGQSSGDWTQQTLHDRATETLAAVAAVASQPEIDATRVGLVGGSQGGWVAPLAAASSKTVSAVCIFSGPGVSVAESERYQIRHEGLREGYPPEEVDAALGLFRRVLHRLRQGEDAVDIYANEQQLRDESFAKLTDTDDQLAGPGAVIAARFAGTVSPEL
jgi:alpha-beta hydrolase superfamily lysophospholipase